MNPASRNSNPNDAPPQREMLVVQCGESESGPIERELTRNPQGQTLTLLEEYRRGKIKTGKRSFYFRLACAAASLTFAVLTFQKL